MRRKVQAVKANFLKHHLVIKAILESVKKNLSNKAVLCKYFGSSHFSMHALDITDFLIFMWWQNFFNTI